MYVHNQETNDEQRQAYTLPYNNTDTVLQLILSKRYKCKYYLCSLPKILKLTTWFGLIKRNELAKDKKPKDPKQQCGVSSKTTKPLETSRHIKNAQWN